VFQVSHKEVMTTQGFAKTNVSLCWIN
jgi:hypothetical protein